MHNTSTVNLLIDMAQKRRDDAAMRMASAMATCTEAEKKLAMLQQYFSDYQNRQRSLSDTDAIVLANFHGFLGKLEAAIARQLDTVHVARRTALQSRQTWEQALQHVKAIEILQNRQAAAARRSVDRAQQKVQDEQSARMVAFPLAMAS